VPANVICPGFARTPLVDNKSQQAKEFGFSERRVIRDVMLKQTVDGEFRLTQKTATASKRQDEIL